MVQTAIRAAILIVSLSLAASAQVVRIPGPGGNTATADSCTGNLLFSWHFEDTTVTSGSPGGCSVGDTTATATGTGTTLSATQFEDGAKAGYFPDAADGGGTNRYYTFDVAAEDIVKNNQGTIDLWIYVTTFVNGGVVFDTAADGNNGIGLSETTASTINQFRIDVNAGGTFRHATTTFASNFLLNTWYHVIAKWDHTAHSSNYIQICADTTTGTTNCGVTTTALGTWAGTLASEIWGNQGSGATTFYIDNVKVYGTWQ